MSLELRQAAVLNITKRIEYYEVKGYLAQKKWTLPKKMVISPSYVKVRAVDEAFSHALLTQEHHKMLVDWER